MPSFDVLSDGENLGLLHGQVESVKRPRHFSGSLFSIYSPQAASPGVPVLEVPCLSTGLSLGYFDGMVWCLWSFVGGPMCKVGSAWGAIVPVWVMIFSMDLYGLLSDGKLDSRGARGGGTGFRG